MWRWRDEFPKKFASGAMNFRKRVGDAMNF
jgi:hypothetical protein